MEQSRKSIYFDLDDKRLKELYPSESEHGYKTAWSKIRKFMETHGFEHIQYSGYESVEAMPHDKVFAVVRELNRTFPWFRPCAQVCRVNEIGDRYDVLEYTDSLSHSFDHDPASAKVSF